MRLPIGFAFAVICTGLMAAPDALARPAAKHHHATVPQKKHAAHAARLSSSARNLARGQRAAFAQVSLSARTTPAVPALVAEARKYMGTNPTDRKRLWCATFMNFILARLGYSGTHSDAAKSFAYYGRRIDEPRVGAIAVLTRGRRGGHVGVVSGIDQNGDPIIISGNHNRAVGEAVYKRSRVIAYVLPTETHDAGTRVAQAGRADAAGLDSPIAELLAAIEAEQPRERQVASRTDRVAAPPLRASARGLTDPFSELFDSLEARQRPQRRAL
jgi:uncharacterized protein (TIGR02594 family)